MFTCRAQIKIQVSYRIINLYKCGLIFIRTSEDVAPEAKEIDAFDGVDLQTEKLTHPTANRAKPPQRRPPSALITAIQVRELFCFLATFSLLEPEHSCLLLTEFFKWHLENEFTKQFHEFQILDSWIGTGNIW